MSAAREDHQPEKQETQAIQISSVEENQMGLVEERQTGSVEEGKMGSVEEDQMGSVDDAVINAFFESFPNRYKILKTSGDGLQCGLFALALIIRHQCPHFMETDHNLPHPDFAELREICESPEFTSPIKDAFKAPDKEADEGTNEDLNTDPNENIDINNTSNFTLDQLALILSMWLQEKNQGQIHLGVIPSNGEPFIYSSDGVEEDDWVLWIHNDMAEADHEAGAGNLDMIERIAENLGATKRRRQ